MAYLAALADLRHGQTADFFAQLAKKESCLTRQGRPYFSLLFRDRRRETAAVIWEGSRHETACRDQWQVGHFYKIRGTFQETIYGGKIEIDLLRPVEEADRETGFDPLECQPVSKHDSSELFDVLLELIEAQIQTPGLKQLVLHIFEQHREPLLELPGALHHHHAYAGGYLEHVFSVAHNVLDLIRRYRGQHSSLRDPLTCDLAVAGALLHDIGKLAQLDREVANTASTIPGELVGHIILGRDIVRDAARQLDLDEPWLVRLEHLILSHQGTFENGSPQLPMTWEANLVYWADELDGNIFRLAAAFEKADPADTFLPRSNPFRRRLYHPPPPADSEQSA